MIFHVSYCNLVTLPGAHGLREDWYESMEISMKVKKRSISQGRGLANGLALVKPCFHFEIVLSFSKARSLKLKHNNVRMSHQHDSQYFKQLRFTDMLCRRLTR